MARCRPSDTPGGRRGQFARVAGVGLSARAARPGGAARQRRVADVAVEWPLPRRVYVVRQDSGAPGSAATAAARSVARTRNSRLRLVLGDYDIAQAHCERAFEEERARDDALGMALALDGLARVAEQRGDLVRAAELFSDVCRHLRDLESPRLAGTLLECAIVASEIGEVEELRELIRDIDDIARDRRDSVLSACVVHLNALVAKRVGDSLTAAELLEQELATRRAEGGQQAIIKALTILGHVRVDLGQHPAALRAFSAAIARARATGERVRLIRALEGYARCLSTSDPESAVRLAGATDGQRQLFGAVPWPSERQYLDAWLKAAQHTLGRTTYLRAWEDGHTSSLDQAVSMAEALAVERQFNVAPRGPLSAREWDVARLLARGLTNKQIAAELIVSPATVRSHVEHILAKLDLRSRAQIAVWATQQGDLPAAGANGATQLLP